MELHGVAGSVPGKIRTGARGDDDSLLLPAGMVSSPEELGLADEWLLAGFMPSHALLARHRLLP